MQYHQNYLILFFILSFLITESIAQKSSNIWLGGREEPSGINTNVLNFNNGSPEIDTTAHPGFLFAANSSYCDPQTGELLAYSDGFRIFNRNHNIITGGDSLSPVSYSFDNWDFFKNYLVGSARWNTVAILPMPGKRDSFAVIHQQPTVSEGITTSDSLFFSQFTISNQNTEGQMYNKNEIIYDKSDGYNSEASSIAVIRHANGRDWWVIIGNSNAGKTIKTHKYHVFLLDPSGIELDHIDEFYHEDGSWYDSFLISVSKKGNKIAVYEENDEKRSVGLYAFNRCTGVISQENRIPMIKYDPSAGYDKGCWATPFSPNGRFLYIIYGGLIIQYDLQEEDYINKGDTVARWSQEIDDQSGVRGHSYFGPSRLGPDGKIYSTAVEDHTRYMHVMHHPNKKGSACEFEQNGIPLPLINKESIPFYVNYNLGPIDGSPCDTLDLNSTATTAAEWNNSISLFPNPIKSDDEITIEFDKVFSGEVLLYDMSGELLKRISYKTIKNTQYSLPSLPSGVYNIVFRSTDQQQTSRKVVIK